MALVGSSGVGKTTLCSLIPRFYEADAGDILLDGRSIRDIRLRSLRSHIGVVHQDVYLFAGTVAENILYGRLDASREEVVAAAKKAHAHDFIMALPEGYDTDIGQRGVKLSGGQKQRLSIARVFLKDPPVIIFDEATSALDNESERAVQDSLETLAHDRTTLVIAHRLSTVRNAQRILVLTEAGNRRARHTRGADRARRHLREPVSHAAEHLGTVWMSGSTWRNGNVQRGADPQHGGDSGHLALQTLGNPVPDHGSRPALSSVMVPFPHHTRSPSVAIRRRGTRRSGR